MLRQILDSLTEKSNLHFRRTGVRLVQTILRNYVFFDVRVLWHFSNFPRIAGRNRARHYTRRLSRSTLAGAPAEASGQLAAHTAFVIKLRAKSHSAWRQPVRWPHTPASLRSLQRDSMIAQHAGVEARQVRLGAAGQRAHGVEQRVQGIQVERYGERWLRSRARSRCRRLPGTRSSPPCTC